jgi:predicted RNA-binding protein YlxR (DUF448 family)
LRPARRLPQRTCIACRSTTGKRELVRIVRTPDGKVEVDPTGKKAGRGAYVHGNLECWDTALKKDRLAKALKTVISAADRQALREYGQSLRQPAEVG